MSIASGADKHGLYQDSVQSPELEAKHITEVCVNFGTTPAVLREDFCGTAALCCAWVGMGKDRRAVGIDIDEETLDWGVKHNIMPMSRDERARVKLLKQDVLDSTAPADVVVALNFSYYCLKDRKSLLRYFRAVRRSINRGGILLLDVVGGAEYNGVVFEKSRMGEFWYVWRNDDFDPITNSIRCSISYRFPDGSRLNDAFVYDWRLWTLPELIDVLDEAGFRDSVVLWDITGDMKDFIPCERVYDVGSTTSSWLCYLVAVK